MKYSIFFLLLLIYGCNSDKVSSKALKNSDTPDHQGNQGNIIPKFEDYDVGNVSAKIDKQTIDKIYNLNKTHFESHYYHREGLEEYCKIFAGKYIGIDMSQGSETVMTYFFDSKTGEMYESPLFMYSAEYKGNSRLYIKDPILDKKQQEECNSGIFDCDRRYYAWNENKKLFEEIK